jgi:hypothetical protein
MLLNIINTSAVIIPQTSREYATLGCAAAYSCAVDR